MFAEVNGVGSAVLFLHGLGGSSYSWPALAGRYTTYVVDLPGFGPHGLPGQESAPLPEHAWNVVGLANAVQGFIRDRHLADLVVKQNLSENRGAHFLSGVAAH